MTIFAPYCYNWSIGNSVYAIDTMMAAYRELGLRAGVSAFVIGDGHGNLHGNVGMSISDVIEFGKRPDTLLIISCGGANGPFLEDTMGEDRQVELLADLLRKTSCRHIDFDVEGAHVSSPKSAQIFAVVKRLKKEFPDLWVSYTLAVVAPSAWDEGGLGHDGVAFLKRSLEAGVRPNVVNCMLMDTYSPIPSGYSNWGDVYIKCMESTLKKIRALDSSFGYGNLGLTPMIGVQDDNSVFTVEDMRRLARWCKEKGCGLLSYWSMQRDQVGDGALFIYSKVNKTNYEFFYAAAEELGEVALPVEQPQDPPEEQPGQDTSHQDPPQTQPPPSGEFSGEVVYGGERYNCTIDSSHKLTLIPIGSGSPPFTETPPPQDGTSWSAGMMYRVGDVVTYKGKKYKCQIGHVSQADWMPDVVPALWVPQ